MWIGVYGNIFGCVVALGAVRRYMSRRMMLVWAQVYSATSATSAADRQIARNFEICVLSCVKESRPAPFTMILDDRPGMLMLMSVVVGEAHETALATVADDAVIVPPTVADDALSGPHTMLPCSVVFV